MCTVSIKVNDALLKKALGNMEGNVEIAEWMQQQIEAILFRMALASEKSESIQRILSFSKADGDVVSLCDLEGILPATNISFEELRDEYISEKYGV